MLAAMAAMRSFLSSIPRMSFLEGLPGFCFWPASGTRGDALFDGRVGLPLGLLQGVELLEVVLRALLPFAGLLDGVLVEGLVVLALGAALGLLRVCLRLLSCRVLACVLHAFLLSGAVRRLVSPRAGHFHV